MKQCTLTLALAASLFFTGVATAQSNDSTELTETQMEDPVRRSYHYDTMFILK